MYIRLIRNEPKGSAITGRLVINGRWFCNTLERVGYQIPALCYHVIVTQSPKFKRLLPLVQNVPASPKSSPKGKDFNSDEKLPSLQGGAGGRQGIRFHRGSKPEHSTGCILVVADNINDNTDNLRPNRTRSDRSNACEIRIPLGAQGEYSSPRQEVDCRGMLSPLSSNKKNIGCRSAADVEQSLTQLLLQTQETHEEIILEVIDFRPGTDYGYNTPCPSSECASEKEIRCANFARRHPSSILKPTRLSDDC